MIDFTQRLAGGMAAILIYSPTVIFLMLVFWSFAFSAMELNIIAFASSSAVASGFSSGLAKPRLDMGHSDAGGSTCEIYGIPIAERPGVEVKIQPPRA